MELSASTYTVPLRPSISTSRNFYPLPPLSLTRYPLRQRRHHFAGAYSVGSLLSLNGVRLRRSSVAAAIADKDTVSNGVVNEQMRSDSVTCQGADMENGEDRKDASRGLDGNKKYGKLLDNILVDKLIKVFLVDNPNPTDWRKLLAFSKKWNKMRPHFYKRCQDRADSETDPEMKHKLLRFQRKLREVDDDFQRHNELLEAVRRSPSEVGDIVAKHRKDFTQEFFYHLSNVAESYYDDLAEQNAVIEVGKTCLAAMQAYDNSAESSEALDAAQLKLQDILNSPSVDVAHKKIDKLALRNKLDPALMLMTTKAWSEGKETDMTKDEVKEIMYHLYTVARKNLQRLIPKEIRILKYLLQIEDPEERMCALKDAFTPGLELQGKDVDYLYTSPKVLYELTETVLKAYKYSSIDSTQVKQLKDMMNPKTIQKVEELKKVIVDNFM